MKEGFVIDTFKTPKTTNENNIFVSYSQFSMWQQCPLRWKLNYIDKLRVFDASIHTIFGDSMHTCIQEYLTVMYTETIKKSDAYDFEKRLLEELKKNYAKALEKGTGHFTTKEQLSEFYLDGLEILNFLRKKRKWYFSPKQEELIGVEIELKVGTHHENVHLFGFIDIVFREKESGKILIKDFKTSTNGWNKWTKSDDSKVNQIILYKLYFAKQYGIDIDDIDVEFFILKRKIDLDSAFPQRRIQVFKPSQGKITYNKVQRLFEEFLNSCFLPDGSYNLMNHFIANTGKNEKNCKFCEFKDDYEKCPKENRLNYE